MYESVFLFLIKSRIYESRLCKIKQVEVVVLEDDGAKKLF